jgi:Tfp pilus assembly protein FimT
LELLLVISIMVVIAAVTVPSLTGMVDSRKLPNSAERLSLEIKEARVRAMRTGQAQMLQFQLGTGEYKLSPWLSVNDESSASSGATMQLQSGVAVEVGGMSEAAQAVDPADRVADKLEEGVIVVAVNQNGGSRFQYEQSVASNNSMASAQIAPPILFYTDGTASTSEIILQDTYGYRKAIRLRGLTGRSETVRLPPAT